MKHKHRVWYEVTAEGDVWFKTSYGRSSHRICKTKRKAFEVSNKLCRENIKNVILKWYWKNGIRRLKEWTWEPRKENKQ